MRDLAWTHADVVLWRRRRQRWSLTINRKQGGGDGGERPREREGYTDKYIVIVRFSSIERETPPISPAWCISS